jgi:ribosomal protein S18 acetylase RimI-like enzyme
MDPARLFAQSRADGHTHELGFLPAEVYARAASEGRIRLLQLNNQPAAFIMHGPPLPTWKIYQTWVEEDARLIDQGRQLVHTLAAEGAAAGVERISLHCATDLPANHFWQQLGFTWAELRERTTRYSRPANRWELILPRGQQLIEYLHAQAPHPRQKKLLAALGMSEQFRAAHTSRFRRQT